MLPTSSDFCSFSRLLCWNYISENRATRFHWPWLHCTGKGSVSVSPLAHTVKWRTWVLVHVHPTWAPQQPGTGDAGWLSATSRCAPTPGQARLDFQNFWMLQLGKYQMTWVWAMPWESLRPACLLHLSRLKGAEEQLKALSPTSSSTALSGNLLLWIFQLPSSTGFNSFLTKNPKSMSASSFWLSVTHHHLGALGFPNNSWSQWGAFGFAWRGC